MEKEPKKADTQHPWGEEVEKVIEAVGLE